MLYYSYNNVYNNNYNYNKLLGEYSVGLLSLGDNGITLVIEEDDREYNERSHHREGRGIVREGRSNESLVLSMP